MDGLVLSQGAAFGTIPNTWTIGGMGDLNGDGKSDIVWRNNDGTVAIWLMNGAEPPSGAIIENGQTMWTPVQIGDFNGDGKADIIWRHRNGDLAIWLMDGPTSSE
jgi:hypothetical protein